MGYKVEVEAAPGTLGDLVLTCSSVKSRNFTFGKKLTKYHVEECLERIKVTVEGYYTASSLRYFVQKTGVKLPLATLVAKIITQDEPREVRGLFANFVKQT
jgi:glycerol-3-phosphate dehydrogenase (NAD(P)+)